MTQPYGQQPGQPGDPQSGGFQQPGYSQGLGGMPAAPQEYNQGPTSRPGTVTAAAVLAFVQAGLTAITTIILLTALLGGGDDTQDGALGWVVAIAQAAGVILLILGGVQAIQGKSRTLLIAGCALELAICVYYLVSFAVIDSGGEEVIEAGKGVLIGFAVFFAVMPAISMVLSLGGPASQYFQSRRVH